MWELAALAICSCAISCWNLGANGGLYYGLKFAVMPSDGQGGKKEGPDQPLCYCPNISANQLIRTPKQLNLDRSKCVLAKEHAAEEASQWTVQSVNINWILQLKNNKKKLGTILQNSKYIFQYRQKQLSMFQELHLQGEPFNGDTGQFVELPNQTSVSPDRKLYADLPSLSR